MILDSLDNWKRYAGLHPVFAEAFQFLTRTDLASLSAGRHPLSGDRAYIVVVRDSGRGRRKAAFEAHRKHIDIQFCLEGTDEIGWKPTAGCVPDGKGFDDAKDVEMFSDAPDNWIRTPPGFFAVFFPEDAHAPLCGTGPMAKIVVKVAV